MQNREQIQPSLPQLLQMTAKARADFARRRRSTVATSPGSQPQSGAESRQA